MSTIEDLKNEIEEQENIEADVSSEESEETVQYNITSYGADYDVEGIVRRLKKRTILIPKFQRNYVWNLNDASRFIESLLLGLPVPGIFLAKERDTNNLLVIDGQQRLKTLQFYYSGYFNPREGDKSHRQFKLSNVSRPFLGKSYEELEDSDRNILDNSIIHTTVIQQDDPEEDDSSSIYHVFERLNTGGRILTPQEIRCSIYHGAFISLLNELNSFGPWRVIFGKENSRLKDQELILRFFSLFFEYESYKKPMKKFLNKYIEKNKKINSDDASRYSELFKATVQVVYNSIGPKAFRPIRALNVAVFDSVMVAIARKIDRNSSIDLDTLKVAYDRLLLDGDYNKFTQRATSDDEAVAERMKIATRYFS